MQEPYDAKPMPPPRMPPYPPMYPPAYARPERMKWENFGMIFITVGAILIGIGIMLAGSSPGDIVIKQGSSSPSEYHPDIRMTTLQIACILAGIGTIFEGLGAAFDIKAHFELEDYRQRR